MKEQLTPSTVEDILQRIPPLSQEPYAIEGDARFPLRTALRRIISLQKAREKELLTRVAEIDKRRHGTPHPPSRRVVSEGGEALEKEARRRPPATSYGLIDCILRSPEGSPLEVQADILATSDEFPREGRKDPFYEFICDRPPEEALSLLNEPTHLGVLWNFFSFRVYLREKMSQVGGPTQIEAINLLTQFNQRLEIPEGLGGVLSELGKLIPISSDSTGYRS